jgi:hypothetical protein
LEAPGFKPCVYEVKSRFQAFAFFKCNLYRYIKALQRPIPAKQPASLSNSVSSLQSFMAANQGIYRYADFNETPLGAGAGGGGGSGGGGRSGGGDRGGSGAADQYGDGDFSGYEGYYQQRGGGEHEAARGPQGWYGADPPNSGGDYRRDDDYRDDDEEDEEEEGDWGLREERTRHAQQHGFRNHAASSRQYETPDQRIDQWGGQRDDDDGGGGRY